MINNNTGICFGVAHRTIQGASKKRNTAKRNMFSAVCALSIYIRLCMKMSSFLMMDSGAYIILIMWNFISGLDAWYHFRFNISCGVAVTGKSH